MFENPVLGRSPGWGALGRESGGGLKPDGNPRFSKLVARASKKRIYRKGSVVLWTSNCLRKAFRNKQSLQGMEKILICQEM